MTAFGNGAPSLAAGETAAWDSMAANGSGVSPPSGKKRSFEEAEQESSVSSSANLDEAGGEPPPPTVPDPLHTSSGETAVRTEPDVKGRTAEATLEVMLTAISERNADRHTQKRRVASKKLSAAIEAAGETEKAAAPKVPKMKKKQDDDDVIEKRSGKVVHLHKGKETAKRTWGTGSKKEYET